jgi:hypothetical protein
MFLQHWKNSAFIQADFVLYRDVVCKVKTIMNREGFMEKDSKFKKHII